jgi:hypothetical protein
LIVLLALLLALSVVVAVGLLLLALVVVLPPPPPPPPPLLLPLALLLVLPLPCILPDCSDSSDLVSEQKSAPWPAAEDVANIELVALGQIGGAWVPTTLTSKSVSQDTS